jgi:hypothetical protein
MTLNIDQEMAGLARLSIDGLRSAYADVFGEPSRSRHREWLVRRILWRRQALDEGDLPDRARRRAAELANDADLRLLPPRPTTAAPAPATSAKVNATARLDSRLPPVGATITRTYKGQTLDVKVREAGFEYEDAVYKSLSAVARAITGQHCNGFHFFRLGKEASQ